MTDKELRKLNRISLLEIIVEQRQRIEELEKKLTEAAEQLDARYIRFDIQNVESREEASKALADVLGESWAPATSEKRYVPQNTSLRRR